MPITPNDELSSSLNRAILHWNKEHTKEQIYPGSASARELGKSVFISYSKQKGYQLESIGRLGRLARALRLFYNDTRLKTPQKEELSKIKKIIASSHLSQKNPKTNPQAAYSEYLAFVFGENYGQIYEALFSQPPLSLEAQQAAFASFFGDDDEAIAKGLNQMYNRMNVSAELSGKEGYEWLVTINQSRKSANVLGEFKERIYITSQAYFKKVQDQLYSTHQPFFSFAFGEDYGKILKALFTQPPLKEPALKEVLASCFGNTNEAIVQGLDQMYEMLSKAEAEMSQRSASEKLKLIDKDALVAFKERIHLTNTNYFQKTQTDLYSTLSETQRIEIGKSNLIFRKFYHKVLDSVSLEGGYLEQFKGSLSEVAIMSVLADLETYKKQGESQFSSEENARMGQSIRELQWAQKWFSPASRLFLRDEGYRKEQAKQIYQELELYEQSAITHPLIIPAGTKTHAVLCRVEKMQEPGRFRLIVVNTGLGASQIHEKQKKNSVGEIRTITRDVVYENLTLKELSKDFFFALRTFRNEGETMGEDSRGFYGLLDRYLLKTEGPARKKAGPERYLQKQGTCSFRSVLEHIRDTLGDELYLKFEIAMIEKASQTVQQEMRKMTTNKISELALCCLFAARTPELATKYIEKLLSAAKHVKMSREQELALFKPKVSFEVLDGMIE